MTDNTWNGIEGLTAEQVERLNDSQRRKVMPDAELRGLARSMAADNLLTALCGDVEPPAEAEVVHGWCDMGDEGQTDIVRTWTGRRWFLSTGGRVEICGMQDQTGATTRAIGMEPSGDSDGQMTAEQAREAAAALLAAAAELERIEGLEDQL